MSLTLRLFVLCAAACAAVDATVSQSGVDFPFLSPESRKIQAAEDENGVPPELDQVESQRKEMLTGRKSAVPAFGLLLALTSASVLWFLVWKCFVKSSEAGNHVSGSRRLAGGHKWEDVCRLEELSPQHLKETSAYRAQLAELKITAEQKELDEQGKKLETARDAYAELKVALQQKNFSEESAAEVVKSATERVEDAKKTLETALADLGFDLAVFPNMEAEYVEAVRKSLEKKTEQHKDREDWLKTLRNSWIEVREGIERMEEALARFAHVQAATAELDCKEMRQAQKAVDDAAFDLKTGFLVAVGWEEAQFVDSASEESEEVEAEILKRLPVLSDEELINTASQSLAVATERLDATQRGLQDLKKKVTSARLLFDELYVAMAAYRDGEKDGADELQQIERRERFERISLSYEEAISRIAGREPAVPGVVKPPESAQEYVDEFCRNQLSAAEGKAHTLGELYERDRKAWEKVKKAYSYFRNLLGAVAKLEAKEATPEETIRLLELQIQRPEAHRQLQKALFVAQMANTTPETTQELASGMASVESAFLPPRAPGAPKDDLEGGKERAPKPSSTQ